MTPFANATTPARFALGTALGLAACALFLLVASNVLLLGLRLHDGGLHWSEIATGWPRYGADPRFDRWLTLATLAGVVVVFGLLGAILRHRPLRFTAALVSLPSAKSRPLGFDPRKACCSAARTVRCSASADRNTSSSTLQPAPARASAM
jgi:hypothetical protein